MTVDAAPPASRWRRALKDVRHALFENKVTLFAGVLFLLFVVIGIIGPYVAPYDPLMTDATASLVPPSAAHPFGTDALGRDILSRVLVATGLDLGMAAGAVALAFFVGTMLGSLAGMIGGYVDLAIERLMDTIMAFPLFVLAMGIVAALGNNVTNIVLATAIINLPFYARFARAEVNVRRELAFVEAARTGGNGRWRTLFVHIVPNILPTMMVQASLNLGWAILNAAGLSFIGLGVRPPTPEWGIMVSEGASYIFSGEWWTFVFPGAALVTAVFCFNLIGDGLRDLADPKGRT
ncbi:putative D,D-dipeptide transport system permease protein DdpC [Hartmannibacter diazotrophicus]|uniref:Putative D,D-dipeptide transport system permease protein DdpC n=1 Tax=Hartmannibacter diazotrophicus TaxID=1482074 RepID=A0A2C9D418_9HYPH|nr:ABC transporter permease [Hartmannibacter diazotrophicus]SON55034.1 putative D,D-dipeptide transport system permease protein DdpC [Hartmannibacter diazotrophicus]